MMKAKLDSNEILQMAFLDEYHRMKYSCLIVVKLYKLIEFEDAWNRARKALDGVGLKQLGG